MLNLREILDLRFSKQTCSKTVFSFGKHFHRANFLGVLFGRALFRRRIGESIFFGESTLRRALLERRAPEESTI